MNKIFFTFLCLVPFLMSGLILYLYYKNGQFFDLNSALIGASAYCAYSTIVELVMSFFKKKT